MNNEALSFQLDGHELMQLHCKFCFVVLRLEDYLYVLWIFCAQVMFFVVVILFVLLCLCLILNFIALGIDVQDVSFPFFPPFIYCHKSIHFEFCYTRFMMCQLIWRNTQAEMMFSLVQLVHNSFAFLYSHRKCKTQFLKINNSHNHMDVYPFMI